MGIEKFNSLQQTYIRICEAQSKPITPDLQVMSSLQTQQLRVDAFSNTKETLQVLLQFLDTDDCRDKLGSLEVVGESSSPTGSAERPQSAPPSRRKTLPSSRHLSLNPNDGHALDAGGQSPLTKLVPAIAKLVSQSRMLQDLTISIKGIAINGLKTMTQSLGKNDQLVRLSLSRCAMGDAGFKEIAGFLAVASINVLDLSGNHLTDDSGESLSMAGLYKPSY